MSLASHATENALNAPLRMANAILNALYGNETRTRVTLTIAFGLLAAGAWLSISSVLTATTCALTL